MTFSLSRFFYEKYLRAHWISYGLATVFSGGAGATAKTGVATTKAVKGTETVNKINKTVDISKYLPNSPQYQLVTPEGIPYNVVNTEGLKEKLISSEGGTALMPLDKYPFSENSQEEIDYYWERLSAVPEAEQYGWLKDKNGLSWQIVPSELDKR